MKVGIFYNSILQHMKYPHKTAPMDAFVECIENAGDTAIVYKEFSPVEELTIDVDAAILLGYAVEKSYRKRLIDLVKLKSKDIIYIDSNIFSYVHNDHKYHRYSIDGIYPTDGKYFIRPLDTSRTNKLLDYHKLELKQWRRYGKHILILAQRTHSWNMDGVDLIEWVNSTITKIKEITDRDIIVRMHPGDRKFHLHTRTSILNAHPDVLISENFDIRYDFRNAWCTVGYNSSPNCASIIEGVPVYLEDPVNSWAKGFSDLSLLESPPIFDRRTWLTNLANIHWSNEEIQNGTFWKCYKKLREN